jgi:hypothetical protein
MVAATFSRRVAIQPSASRKRSWHKNCRRPSLGHPAVSVGIPYRLDVAARQGVLDNPRKKVVVITDSPPSTPRTWCTAVKVAAAEALTPSGTSGTARSYAGPDKACRCTIGFARPARARARVGCAALLRQLRGNCWALIVSPSARRYRDHTGTYKRSSLRTACTTSRRLTLTFS